MGSPSDSGTAILDLFENIEEELRFGGCILLIDEHGASLKSFAVAFTDKEIGGIEQRVTEGDQLCSRLLADVILLETDSLIARRDGRATTRLAISSDDGVGNLDDFPASFFFFSDLATEAPEGLDEKGRDKVRLEPAGFRQL